MDKIRIKQKIPTRQLNVLTYRNRKYSKEINFFIDLLINKMI